MLFVEGAALPDGRKPATTKCPVTMKKKGTAIRASTLVRKKSAPSWNVARGEVWIAMTARAAKTLNEMYDSKSLC